MTQTTRNLDHSDDSILYFDVSDDALEAAASALPGPALSFPGAPTVSILFACCSNDYASSLAERSTAESGTAAISHEAG